MVDKGRRDVRLGHRPTIIENDRSGHRCFGKRADDDRESRFVLAVVDFNNFGVLAIDAGEVGRRVRRVQPRTESCVDRHDVPARQDGIDEKVSVLVGRV